MGFLIFSFVIIFFLKMIINVQEEQKQEEEQRKKQEKEEMERQRKKDIENIKQFAKNNNLDIDDLFEERDKLYASAVRTYVSGRLAQPMIPSKVTPVYRGNATAEYVASKMNAERQANYNYLLSNSHSMISKSMNYQRLYQSQEETIFKKLKSIPESEEYIEILQQYYSEDRKIFEK